MLRMRELQRVVVRIVSQLAISYQQRVEACVFGVFVWE